MSNDENTNGTKKSKLSVSLSPYIKDLLIIDSEENFRPTSQHLEYILKIYFNLKDKAKFQDLLKTIK